MLFDVILHPTQAFEDALHNPHRGSALIVVLLSAFFFALVAYFTIGKIIPAVYAFVMIVLQWLVLSAIVWFFEFVHVRKRKHMTGTGFNQIAAVVGKLWVINLIGAAMLALIAFLLPFATSTLMGLIGPLFLLIAIVLFLAWIIASFRMLKVVFGAQRLKLVINWILVNVLNMFAVGFIGVVLAKLLF